MIRHGAVIVAAILRAAAQKLLSVAGKVKALRALPFYCRLNRHNSLRRRPKSWRYASERQFQCSGMSLPISGYPARHCRAGPCGLVAAAGLAAPDQIMLALFAREKLREDRGGEARVVELDR